MTDQYTPTTEQVELLVLGQLKQSAQKRGWPVDVEADRADFRRWLSGVEAAAEQRGAIKALRDAAESPDLIGHMYREYGDHPLRSTLAPRAVRATSNYLHTQADQMEGDDETH